MSTANFDRFDLSNATTNSENVREQLHDVITNISPTQTPFQNMIGSGSADNTFFEWLVDELMDVDPSNALIDGADAGTDDSEAADRLANECQISGKTIRVSGRSDAVNKAGRSKELSYQLAKAGKSIKRDVEAIITGNQASLKGDSSTASTTGSLRAWLETNALVDATSGANGGFNTTTRVVDAATDSSATRALTETLLRTVIRQCYEEGGEPSVIMVAPSMKQVISEYLFTSSARVATLYSDQEGQKTGTAMGTVDVFISDFGSLKIVPNRFQGHTGTAARDRDVFVLDTGLWSLDYLRKYRTHKLARTGDAENRQMLVDYGLRSKNEKGSGVIADVDSTAAMTA